MKLNESSSILANYDGINEINSMSERDETKQQGKSDWLHSLLRNWSEINAIQMIKAIFIYLITMKKTK